MSERVAVVTGAGSGIGRAKALAFISEGTPRMVAGVDRRASPPASSQEAITYYRPIEW